MRYLPSTKENREDMLKSIGINSIEELYNNIDGTLSFTETENLPEGITELEIDKYFAKISDKNINANNSLFFLGAGCYFHHIPASVDHLIQRSEFLTSYTPYQAEISQGTLISIFEFQTIIARLTGMDVANASMYDGHTATAEAALMALRITKKNKILLSGNLHPQYKEVVNTYINNLENVSIEEFDNKIDKQTACVIVQNPDFYGNIIDIEKLSQDCKESGALLVVVVNEILSLGLLPPPELADIVVGEAQSIGVSMSFGGPHLGFFACKKQYLRQLPGRICGQTIDKDNKKSFVLTLNAREQHIRREKATSNICTNQALCALAFTIHSSLLGETGFKKLALLNHQRACYLFDELNKIDGIKCENNSFFNEFTILTNINSKKLVKDLEKKNIIAGLPLENNRILVTATEMNSRNDIDKFTKTIREVININA